MCQQDLYTVVFPGFISRFLCTPVVIGIPHYYCCQQRDLYSQALSADFFVHLLLLESHITIVVSKEICIPRLYQQISLYTCCYWNPTLLLSNEAHLMCQQRDLYSQALLADFFKFVHLLFFQSNIDCIFSSIS